MDPGLILETTFLVDLEREAAPREPGPALPFLSTVPDARRHVTLTPAGEMACGVSPG